MNVSDFDDGDGFETPFISGYEVLYDRILDDMENDPEAYEEGIIDLFKGYFHCQVHDPRVCWRQIQDYIDEWCKQRSCAYFS